MEPAGGVLEVRLVDLMLNEAVAQRHALRPGAYVRLTVRDTGCGIEPTLMARIFDPYFTTKEVGQGTGMGLAIVHGIVKHHGGSISAQSALGQGASFQVYLPVREAATVLASPQTVSLSLGQECILFIDDESALVRMGQEYLVQPAGITQRVPLVATRRISRAVWFSCTSIESVSDVD